MSDRAMRHRHTMPTRWQLREELSAGELAEETIHGRDDWEDYRIETGRAYQ